MSGTSWFQGVPSSPAGGRSESPSPASPAPPQAAESRAAEPLSGAKEPLTQTRAVQALEATVHSDRWQGAPAGGREDEPEHGGGGRTRYIKVQLPAGTAAEVESACEGSGLFRTHFLSVALVLGVREFAAQLKRREQ